VCVCVLWGGGGGGGGEVFRRLHQIAKCDCWLRHVYLSTPTRRIFMKFDFDIFFLKSVEKIQVSLQSDTNNRYFTARSIYIFDHISLSSSYNEKCFRQNLWRKSKQTFCVQLLFSRKLYRL